MLHLSLSHGFFFGGGVEMKWVGRLARGCGDKLDLAGLFLHKRIIYMDASFASVSLHCQPSGIKCLRLHSKDIDYQSITHKAQLDSRLGNELFRWV